MEFLPQILLLSSLLLFGYFWFKPRTKPKPNPQKQEEIRQMYRQRLHAELERIQNPDERQAKKIVLLKEFAKELEFNLFFDKSDVQALMKELAGY
ncbi:hypothetical protein [Sulfurospirillum barnesii]|uniref:Uncharacterized protein n=1 Tax=Sulfurospirillum barnesii (strain ATCC 700032 / DSM 10660 / SES-3) TaxID=760154 RepID=I3XZC6_SULBS|nr:hypothetical protein [Sulfurospirillum barnesii]AFL69300.1 hypothetical protein Sulba_2021 [Sulfurospirillum barnesii SES-3]